MPLKKNFYRFVKRLVDIILSVVGLVVCLIPMLVVAVLIRIDSKGPVFFRQERLGLGGREFMMYKFRSMHVDAEADGPQWAAREDERVTKIGRFLRNTRLDEIPQMLNILKGDMSFVGPRPERAYFYEKFSKYIDGFDSRLLVKPGLTGYAQVNGGYDLKPQEKLAYDIEYIKKCGFLMDLKCIVKTVAIVFTHDGAH